MIFSFSLVWLFCVKFTVYPFPLDVVVVVFALPSRPAHERDLLLLQPPLLLVRDGNIVQQPHAHYDEAGCRSEDDAEVASMLE